VHRLSDVLGRPVVDGNGKRVGYVEDVTVAREGADVPNFGATFVVDRVVVGFRGTGRLLALERPSGTTPLLFKLFLRWMRRAEFEVDWADLEVPDSGAVRLRPGVTRHPGGPDR